MCNGRRRVYNILIGIAMVLLFMVPMAVAEEVEVFEPKQFREYIEEVLSMFAEQCNIHTLATANAVELLMLTAAQESHLGRYLKQVRGPAMGVFQIEPSTMADLIRNYLAYRKELGEIVRGWKAERVDAYVSLMGDLPFQIIVARLIYRRVPEPLPHWNDTEAVAKYWKKYWNTELGRGTVEEAIANYKRYVTEG